MQKEQDPGLALIIEERNKQLQRWSDQHDDQHDDGSLVRAAMTCLAGSYYRAAGFWPPSWSRAYLVEFRKKTREERLAIAGALIAAELSRLERLEEKEIEETTDALLDRPN